MLSRSIKVSHICSEALCGLLQLCRLSPFPPSVSLPRSLSPSLCLLSHVSLGCGLRRRNHLPRQTCLALRKLKCAVRRRPGMSLSLQNTLLVKSLLSRAALECLSKRWRSPQLPLLLLMTPPPPPRPHFKHRVPCCYRSAGVCRGFSSCADGLAVCTCCSISSVESSLC